MSSRLLSTPGGRLRAAYTGSNDRYFYWSDAPGRSARELGLMFLGRFRRIAEHGFGRDWPYAGWLTEILGKAERDDPAGFPAFFADYPLDLKADDFPPGIGLEVIDSK